MDYDTAKKAADAAKELMEARNAMDQLKKDEESYLADREKKARIHLEQINREIENGTVILESLVRRSKERQKDIDGRMRGFGKSLDKTIDAAERMMESSETLKIKSENLFEELNNRIAEVDKATLKLSEWESGLKEREKKAEGKIRSADRKLQEAKDLAYWHKTGQRYTQI